MIVAIVPRCYSQSDPELNSTAWFAEYIGPFISFLTLEDLQTFGAAQVLNIIWGIMSFTKIWIAKDMRINNLTPTVFLCRISRCSQWTLSTSHSSTTPSYLPTSPTTTLSSFISRTATSVPYCESKPLKCGFTFQPQAPKYFFRHYVRERYYAICV